MWCAVIFTEFHYRLETLSIGGYGMDMWSHFVIQSPKRTYKAWCGEENGLKEFKQAATEAGKTKIHINEKTVHLKLKDM